MAGPLPLCMGQSWSLGEAQGLFWDPPPPPPRPAPGPTSKGWPSIFSPCPAGLLIPAPTCLERWGLGHPDGRPCQEGPWSPWAQKQGHHSIPKRRVYRGLGTPRQTLWGGVYRHKCTPLPLPSWRSFPQQPLTRPAAHPTPSTPPGPLLLGLTELVLVVCGRWGAGSP